MSRCTRIQNAVVFGQGTHQASLDRDDTLPDAGPKDNVGSFVAVDLLRCNIPWGDARVIDQLVQGLIVGRPFPDSEYSSVKVFVIQ
jgi:hypothetical protein